MIMIVMMITISKTVMMKLPMDVTLVGIVTDTNWVQVWKAAEPYDDHSYYIVRFDYNGITNRLNTSGNCNSRKRNTISTKVITYVMLSIS